MVSGNLKKKPKLAEEDKAVVTQEKASSKLKKASSEIDEIFAASKKRKRLEEENKGAGRKQSKASISAAKTRNKKGIGESSRSKGEGLQVGSTTRPRKKTLEGLAIYTEEELGLGKADAGGTALCPFDCSCCF